MENSEILEKIKAGDKETIKSVYMENMKDVYNFAKEITGEHDSAIEATKKAFTTLFNNIKKGQQPANIRTAALKLAYDEACRMVLPSSENIDSPFDKEEKQDVTAPVEEEKIVPLIVNDVEEKAEAEDVKPAKPMSSTQVFSITDVTKDGEVTLADDDVEDDDYDEDYDEDDEDDNETRGGVKAVIIIINIILVIILLWLLYGLLCNFNIIPENLNFDLGYSWVNEHIYTLF